MVTFTHTHPNTSAVVKRSRIMAADIQAVAHGDALALMVPEYFALEECALLRDLLLGSDRWTTYSEDSGAAGIGTLGTSLFGCMGQELCPTYFDEGVKMHRTLREIVHPYVFPADRVQVELDHAWPTGASLLHINGRPAFYGLTRAFREGGAALPHTDRADWDYLCAETAQFSAQLFMNVYLSKTQFGGKVRLWTDQPERDEYNAKRLEPGHYALDADLISKPAIEIDVPAGCLLFANAWRIHEVTASTGEGARVSVSGFLGYSGDDAPLRMFS